MKSDGAAVRISKGRPPAARMASCTIPEMRSRCEKQTDRPLEVLTTAILGLSKSLSGMPMAVHCATRTAQRVDPGSKLLR